MEVILMAIKGTYTGTVIEIGQQLEPGQDVLVIPLGRSLKKDMEKQSILDRLYGSVNSDMTLSEIREERLKKYETVD
jgi:hypothetical protein